jgi:FkbM family methyltransferase
VGDDHQNGVRLMFIPPDEVVWKPVQFLELPDETFEYEFYLPVPLADWDVFACWERERFHSMRDNLEYGDVLFDVGTEQGWCNLIYADMVGPENMVLVEPTQEFWPNIKAAWERNYTVNPRGCYPGLMSDVTGDKVRKFTPWPAAADGDLIDRNKYQYLHDHTRDIKQLTLDDLVQRSGIIPDAITMDVEGAELRVLQGATNTLIDHQPLVWVSVHPDLIERDYDATSDRVHTFMESHGYQATLLATDHEQHWFYQP